MTQSITKKLAAQKRGEVLLIELCNPPANTWDEDSLSGLRQLIEDATKAGAPPLIVTGSGEKFFSAGADLKLFASGHKAVARQMADGFGAAFEALMAYPGVSIAAINGYAMGGGLECALACDIRIAAAHSQMALPEASVGLLPCGGGTQNLSWLVGEGWAKRMILCNERVDAQTALKIGLVEQVVAADAVLDQALALAQGALRQSPSAIAACKRLIGKARHQSFSGGNVYSEERDAFVRLFDDGNQQEGVNAFLEKRDPKWQRHG